MYELLARSTATCQSPSGAPTLGDVGTTYQTTCHVAGQLKVNQRRVALAGIVPVNCTPTRIMSSSERQCLRHLPSEHGEPRLDVDRDRSKVGDADPIGDELVGRALHLYLPLDLRPAGPWAGRNHCPHDVPMRGPTECEPAVCLVRGDRPCELHAPPGLRLQGPRE